MRFPSRQPVLYTLQVKPVRITRHARNRMRWRRIGEDLVRAAIDAPDWEEASGAGWTNRWKQASGRFLRVTCREELDRIVVISAVFKRTPPRSGERP